MSKLSKGYFATLKGKKVTFKRVKFGGDIKVEFVDRSPDFEVYIDWINKRKIFGLVRKLNLF